MTQNNLGNALVRLGGQEGGTVRLQQAANAYSAALHEWTRERVPLQWAMTQNNLGNVLRKLGERGGGTVHLREAIDALNAALQERTRDRVPLEWARTQASLGHALLTFGQRENSTKRLREAVAAFDTCLKGVEGIWPPDQVNALRESRDRAQAELMRRTRRKS